MAIAVNQALDFVEALGRELSSGTLHLPSFPDTVVRTRQALDDPDCDAVKLARIIGSDPVLAAQTVRMANSAAYNPSGERVSDLPRAISRLGHNTIRNTALALAVRQLAQSDGVRELRAPLGVLWEHSVQVAALSHVVARKLTRLNPDEAMLAGLVHDIGKFYILRRTVEFPALFCDEITRDELMRDWHTGVGRAIIEEWQLSEQTALVADEHESLDREHLGAADLTDVVQVANLLTNEAAGRLAESLDCAGIPAFRRLGLDRETSDTLLQESSEQMQSMVSALNG